MGLTIEVGMLAGLVGFDPQGAEWLRRSFGEVNEVPVQNGLPPHQEPEQLLPMHSRAAVGSFPYSFLHDLCRFYARVVDDAEVAWPFGLGELNAEVEWDTDTSTRVDIVPDRQKWLAASQAPLTVIVGLEDTAELPLGYVPGQKGRDQVTIAQSWVADMAAFAEENGLESRFEIDIIPGVGHSMSGLLPYSQEALISHRE
jgi:hypothetical protein